MKFIKVAVLRIEHSDSVCVFNIAIFPISFFNAKWIWTSMECLTIKPYLHIKIYLDYFPGRLKKAKLGKSVRLTV